jgi:hypothetical protein
MSRRYPNRRRRRKGRPPPHRYKGSLLMPDGFHSFGLKYMYDWLFPRLGVRNRRVLFNRWAAFGVLSTGAFGAVYGASLAGPLGAIIGGSAGLIYSEHAFRRHRLFR